MERDADFVSNLWDKYLKGGVVICEYSTFLAEDAENAWLAGADIAAILACQAAIETHLRFEMQSKNNAPFAKLVEEYGFKEELKNKINEIRKIRNKWVHVRNPAEDEHLQVDPIVHREQLSEDAKLSLETMVAVFCENQWV